jgi:hypothetical protein
MTRTPATLVELLSNNQTALQSMQGADGGITWEGNSTSQSFVADEYTKVLNAASDMSGSGVAEVSTSSKLTVVTAGRYNVHVSLSFTTTTSSVNVTGGIFVGGVIARYKTEKVHRVGDVCTLDISGITSVSASQDIDVRLQPDLFTTITVTDGSLWMRLSG